MAELVENSLAPRVPFLDEEEIREIEKRTRKDPMNVGSFHVHNIHPDLAQTYRAKPLHICLDNFSRPKPEEIIATSTVRQRAFFFDLNLPVSFPSAAPVTFSQLSACWVFFSPSLPPAKKESKVELGQEAAKRLSGHEELLEAIVLLTEDEASSRNVPIVQIGVSPAWSHEYEDRTGLVVRVEIKGTDDQRFSFWDSLSEKIDHLSETLATEEQVFLANDVSFLVTQG